MHIPKEVYSQVLSSLPIACVDLLILHKDKCLLLLRDNEPAKGQYWFPGGRIYKNETIHEAALRKGKEETKLDCSFEKIICIEETLFPKIGEMQTDVHTINICCLMKIVGDAGVQPDYLHTDYLWADKLRDDLHPGVMHPLSKIGFTF